YALIPADARADAHLRLGREMLALTPAANLDEEIFEIVNQLNRGAAAIVTASEREAVARLDLRAGRRAMTSSAHASALAFLAAGTERLGPEAWTDQYRLLFDMELHRAECEIVCGDMAAAEPRLRSLLDRADALQDRANVV